MVFPSSPLQKSSHCFYSPSRGKSKPQLFLHFLRRNNNPLGLNTKKNQKTTQHMKSFSHRNGIHRFGFFAAYLRDCKKKVFPTKTKTLDRARGHKSKRRERVSFGSRAQNPDLEIRVECRWRIFIPILGPRLGEISGLEKTLTPVSITRNYFHRRSGHVAAWRNVAVHDKRACVNLSWQPRIGFSLRK
jgi:hypothetical protein